MHLLSMLQHRIMNRLLPAILLPAALILLLPGQVFAQDMTVAESGIPLYWYLLTAALSLLVPAGFVLIAVAELSAQQAWRSALGALGAIGLAGLGYWAIGFALHFGGVGLVYPDPGLRNLVWEWSPLSTDWGIGWGMAGLSGWFLAGGQITSLSYALFLAHLPWALTTALIVVVALRGRAPVFVTFILALVIGAFVYPLAGNWVQGGGWLNALGRNLSLGHGFVDFGGAGSVHLLAAGFSLAALVVWGRRRDVRDGEPQLPPAQLPLLAVLGGLLLLTGAIGWLWANPLQVGALSEIALMRGSVNVILAAGAGALVPLVYTWFVGSESHPVMSARGLAAGMVAILAIGPFVQPGPAFLIGLLAGATVPFVTWLLDGVLHLDDATAAVTVSGVPAIVGLFLLSFFADGVVGRGWQMTGLESYLGVTGQGVSGLLVAQGFQADFPGQLQAQLIGILALSLWGFLMGLLICAPLGLLAHGLTRGEQPPQSTIQPLAPASQNRAVGERDAGSPASESAATVHPADGP